MNVETIQRILPVFFLALALALSGCQENGEMYSDNEQPSGTPRAATTQSNVPEGSAPMVVEPRNTEEEAPAQMDEETKDSLAEMGHQLPAPPEDRETLAEGVPTVERVITGVAVTVPESWEAVPQDQLSAMRAAQLSIPPAEGSEHGAELVAFNFGPGQGGSVLANVQRWLQQIEPEDPSTNRVYQQELEGLSVTEVYAKGTLLPSTMGMGPTEPQPESALYGIIIEGAPEGNIFLKITGDRETIENAEPALATLVQSVKLADPHD